jgi:hypothetical protein
MCVFGLLGVLLWDLGGEVDSCLFDWFCGEFSNIYAAGSSCEENG